MGLVLLLPPLIWWQGLASHWVGILLLAIGASQLLGARAGFNLFQGAVAICFALFIWLGSKQLTLYYPALVNASLLMLWFYSWMNPPTIIERLAPRAHTAVERKRRYMRRLTLAWCGIFTVNLLLALATAWLADLSWWVAWNGLGAYLLVALFAASEYAFRKFWHERVDGQGVA